MVGIHFQVQFAELSVGSLSLPVPLFTSPCQGNPSGVPGVPRTTLGVLGVPGITLGVDKAPGIQESSD
ncbi:hypothetical protein SUGI_0813010 [Cryptomeria japonica]|nr:hypothetical protein SUGI_0813010 [Cryptomeria japonica]